MLLKNLLIILIKDRDFAFIELNYRLAVFYDNLCRIIESMLDNDDDDMDSLRSIYKGCA